MKIRVEFSCEDSSMLISSVIDVERNYNYLLNIITSLGPIPYFHFVTKMLYIWKVIIEKLQCQTVVGQEILAINDLQIPINKHFLVQL